MYGWICEGCILLLVENLNTVQPQNLLKPYSNYCYTSLDSCHPGSLHLCIWIMNHFNACHLVNSVHRLRNGWQWWGGNHHHIVRCIVNWHIGFDVHHLEGNSSWMLTIMLCLHFCGGIILVQMVFREVCEGSMGTGGLHGRMGSLSGVHFGMSYSLLLLNLFSIMIIGWTFW